MIRRSKYVKFFPHFIWCRDLKDAEIEHYVPEHPIERKFPPLFFKGKVKREDK